MQRPDNLCARDHEGIHCGPTTLVAIRSEGGQRAWSVPLTETQCNAWSHKALNLLPDPHPASIATFDTQALDCRLKGVITDRVLAVGMAAECLSFRSIRARLDCRETA